MEISNIINSIGLGLDIIGVILIFFYGISPMIDTGGSTLLDLGGRDETDIKKAKKYKATSNLGLVLIISGFVAQIISNFNFQTIMKLII